MVSYAFLESITKLEVVVVLLDVECMCLSVSTLWPLFMESNISLFLVGLMYCVGYSLLLLTSAIRE